MKSYSVYLLTCNDETFYTGVTSNLDQRIMQHHSGHFKNSYTSKRLPIELVWYCDFSDPHVAFAWEKKIKNWSKAKKMALINNEYEKLPNLSKKKFNID
jgi:putative endonuclease